LFEGAVFGHDYLMSDAGASAVQLTVIVVSYGTRNMTLECLASLVRETHKTSYEVLVVDNASQDGSPEAIREQFPQFKLFAQTENLGFAAANNLAAPHARGKYILLLNPDTVVLEGAIDRLMAFARRRPQARIWGGRTLFADRSLNPTSCWRKLTLWGLFCRSAGLSLMFPNWGLFNRDAYGGWLRDSEREVDIVTGCLFLITRDLWNRLGGFDPDFFMYGEEADLCLRAYKLGARPAITPDATIIHYGGGTESDNIRKERRLLAAKARLIRRYIEPPSTSFALGLLALRPWLKRFVSNRDDRQAWRDIWTDRRGWLAGEF
jgi:N-acetylglucosaminyl-diphospho-decaprenol L-rhamnosyltransferase